MHIIYKSILLGITMVSLAACTNPESLIEKDRKSEEEKILETFSDKEIIKLADLDVQLKEVEQANEGDQSVISLTLVVISHSLPEKTEIDNHIFSVTAEQNQEPLTSIDAIDSFVLDNKKELIYRFILHSNTDVVLFTFDYTNNAQQMTKHYDVYLE